MDKGTRNTVAEQPVIEVKSALEEVLRPEGCMTIIAPSFESIPDCC